MNILLITTRLNLGGIGVYTLLLAKSLNQRGSKVIVASSGGLLAEGLKKEGIEHIKIPVDTSADIGLHTFISYLKLSHIINEHKIDIIHAQTRVAQVIGNMLSRKHKLPLVTTCHGFFKRRWFRRKFPCWGEKVIAISDAVREHLVNDMKVAKDNIKLIYNGIDMKRYMKPYTDDDRLVIRKEYGLKDIKTIGIISRLTEAKGHKYLIGAFAKLLQNFSDIQLLIIGDGPNNYLKALKKQVHALGVEDKVIFHAACEDTSIPLSVIDIFCLPTLQEGLGLSILEAMAAGIPVVASNVGGIYTLIKHKENGFLVPPADEDALAEAISVILSDSSLSETMGKHSRNLAVENFTLEMMTDKVLGVYEEVKSEK
ncbi:MAG: glycosyltransferase family 4 protein [Candidatus Omnitrophota bacterium]